MIDTNQSKTKVGRRLLRFAFVNVNHPRCARIDNIGLPNISQYFDNRIFSLKHKSIVEDTFLIFFSFEVVNRRHLKFAFVLIKVYLMCEYL